MSSTGLKGHGFSRAERAANLMRALAPAGALTALLAVVAAPAAGQLIGQVSEQPKAGTELRSVAVLEWTGDIAHPKASRLVPISVYDGQQLQDGGIYLARPQPLALDSETEYELQKDGKNLGLFDVNDASDVEGTWVGLGDYKPLPTGPTPQQLAAAAARQKVDVDDADNDEPILHRKYHPDDANSNAGSGSSASNAPAPDPDRPTLHRDDDSGAASTASNAPPPDPDRPRLHEDEDAPSKPASPALVPNPANDVAHVTDLPSISDPDRPRLLRGGPVSYGPKVRPTLIGLPPEMEQEVAISDTHKIAEHPWDYAWANPADEVKMKSDLEDIARKALGLEQPAPPAKAKTRRTSVHHKTTPPAPAPPAPLVDEQFRVLELQYGGGATMVFSAHTAGTGADEKFVTLIAQPDLYGGVVVLLKNITDAAHLDMTPRMRLIDAVDALNDNRGELLFELRGQTQRQFVLYRVLRGQATKIFTSGVSYYVATGE